MILINVETSGFYMISNGWYMVTFSEGFEAFSFCVVWRPLLLILKMYVA